ncbi:hypothetical protein [Muricoccus vinaceus]|uniref:Uncharacterized protein n=1 Tax=Muricoccus vinaceus TaxID=424704 RepID=A0ABV6INJ2_9PROT
MQPTRNASYRLIGMLYQMVVEDLPGCREHAGHKLAGSPKAHFRLRDPILARFEAVLALVQRTAPLSEFLGSSGEEHSLTVRSSLQLRSFGLGCTGPRTPLVGLGERRLSAAEPVGDGSQRLLLRVPAGARQASPPRPDPGEPTHRRHPPVDFVLPCPHGSAIGACLAPSVLPLAPCFRLHPAAVMQQVSAELRIVSRYRGEVDVDVRLVDVPPNPEHLPPSRPDCFHPACSDPPQPILDVRAVHLGWRSRMRMHLGVEGPLVGPDAVARWCTRLGSEPVVLGLSLLGWHAVQYDRAGRVEHVLAMCWLPPNFREDLTRGTRPRTSEARDPASVCLGVCKLISHVPMVAPLGETLVKTD